MKKDECERVEITGKVGWFHSYYPLENDPKKRTVRVDPGLELRVDTAEEITVEAMKVGVRTLCVHDGAYHSVDLVITTEAADPVKT